MTRGDDVRRRGPAATVRDTVVILARGASRRMGYPKGRHRPVPEGATLLERVVTLYRSRRWPVVVVTHPSGRRAYADLLDCTGACWLVAPPGGGTARTCLVAAAALGAAGRRFWFHPVDLPDVRPATLNQLRAAAVADPTAVLVPVYRGTRGHPVVVPGDLLAGVVSRRPRGAMSVFMMRRGWPHRFLAVSDAGCVRDVDAESPQGTERSHRAGNRPTVAMFHNRRHQAR